MKSSATPTVRTFRNEPRRRFSTQYKRELVEMVMASPLSLARLAREHELNHNQLARWRREYEQGKYAVNGATDISLLAVCMDEASSALEQVTPASRSLPERDVGVSVELHLAKGRVVINGIDEHTLRRLIETMQ
jgi:transposase